MSFLTANSVFFSLFFSSDLSYSEYMSLLINLAWLHTVPVLPKEATRRQCVTG